MIDYKMHRQRLDILLVLILGLTLIRGIVYASVIPPWQAPDEPKHFEYVALLWEKGQLVTKLDTSLPLQQEIISSMRVHDYWRFGHANTPEQLSNSFTDIWKGSPTELDRPPLYYLGALPFYAPLVNATTEEQLYAVRLFSVLLGLVTVLMTFLAAKTIFPKDSFLPLAAASFVAFLPMHTFITSSVNSDNLANVIAATLAYVMARLFKEGATLRKIVGVFTLLLAGFWTKRTTLFAVPLMVLAMPIHIVGRRLRSSFWVLLAGSGLALVAAVALIARSYRVRVGLMWVLDHYVFNYSAESNLALFQQNSYTPGAVWELYSVFSRRIFDSFWAQFGWMNVRLDDFWYGALLVLGLLSLIGLLRLGILLATGRDRLEPYQMRVLGLFILWILLVSALTYVQYTASFSVSSYPQGRYLFTALVPIAIFFVLGLKNLVPKLFQPALLPTVVGTFFLFDTLGLFMYIIPFYYQPH